MSETYFCADLHLDHPGVLLHCKRPWIQNGDLNANGKWVSREIAEQRAHEMSVAMVTDWNKIVTSNDLVYFIGDLAWKNHRKWINELKGKKVLIVGNHDRMPQDALDLFKPDWTCGDLPLFDVVKTLQQFREVHQLLDRVICGQRMTLCHYPMRAWSSSVHGTWCLCGHSHGRMTCSLPGNVSGGLLLDVGWDVWKKPLSFAEVKVEMMKKLAMMPMNFQDHVLMGTKLVCDIDTIENE